MSRKRKSASARIASSSPARKLIECSPHRTTGGAFIPGLTELHAEHESPNERLALAYLALCHDVDALASQPFQNEYCGDDGERRRYTPDFVVSIGSSRLFLEVKALTFLVREDSLQKYVAIARHYVAQRQPFAFLVDAQLEALPRAASVRLLFRYVTSPVPISALEKASSVLANGAMRINDVCHQASLQLVDVYTLIATKRLCIDWMQPLSSDALVSLPDQPYGGLKLGHVLHSTRFGDLLEELALGRRPTDRQVLANAQAWRQSRHSLTPYCFVGGFPKRKPFRDLRDDEGLPRSPMRRRDHAPGRQSKPTDGDR